MNARFQPSVSNNRQACRPLDDAIPSRVAPVDHADCCLARPTVRVTMPPTQARPRPADLMLCGHHFRVSRAALAVVHAEVRALPGTSDDIAAWIGADSFARA
jgi:5-methylcytosine-specific restriction endonuclease McrA